MDFQFERENTERIVVKLSAEDVQNVIREKVVKELNARGQEIPSSANDWTTFLFEYADEEQGITLTIEIDHLEKERKQRLSTRGTFDREA